MPACEKGHGSNRSAGHAQQHWPPIDGFSRNFRDLQPVQKASEGSQFLQQTSDRLSLTSGFFEQPQSLAAVVEAGGNLAVLPNLGTDRVDRKPTADLFQKNPVGMANGVSVFGPILVIGKYDEAIVLVLRRSSVPQEQTSRKDDPPGPGDPRRIPGRRARRCRKQSPPSPETFDARGWPGPRPRKPACCGSRRCMWTKE